MSNIKIIKLFSDNYIANSYVLAGENGRGILIDCGAPSVLERVPKDIKITTLLLTHGHFDHIGGAAKCGEKGIRVGCYEAEKDIALYHNEGDYFGVSVPTFSIDFTFNEGRTNIDGTDIEVLYTPGHTRGSVCFIAGGALFSGDTLFCGGYGRTDLYSGNENDMRASLKKLFALNGDYDVYPGHGPASTLSAERTVF